MRLVSSYRYDYLRSLLPASRIAAAGTPPAVPAPPRSADVTEWTAWYQHFGAWAIQQQAWSAQVYKVLLDEVAAGALSPETVQASARRYLQDRLPDYLADMAALNLDLVCDLLSVADGSVDALSEALLGTPPGDELTVDVRGAPGTIATTALVIENNQAEPATVECRIDQMDGFGIVTAPDQFRLAGGESQKVVVQVSLPPDPTEGAVLAGSVTVRGQGDRDLVVRVRANAEPAATQRGGLRVSAEPPPQ
jgi:hypothetical protein